MIEKIYTPEELADICKVHKSTIIKMLKNGKIPANKVGKQWRILASEWRKYIAGPNFQHLINNEKENMGP